MRENVKKLVDKVAVVTGAGRGLGRAIALLFAREGAKVVVNDYGVTPEGVNPSSVPAREVAEEIRRFGGECAANTDTVEAKEGAENIIRSAVETYGTVDILVNNAGVVRDRMIFNLSDLDWEMVVKVNLYGTFYCTRAAAKLMRERKWGRIINVSSTAGLGRTLGCANYAAAKEGIIGFSRAVALDMVKYNVTCNAVRPLAMTRHFDGKRREAWSRQGKDMLIEEVERSKPEDVAKFVLFLASQDAAHITGRSFFVSGRRIGVYSEPELEREMEKESGFTLEDMKERFGRLSDRSIAQ